MPSDAPVVVEQIALERQDLPRGAERRTARELAAQRLGDIVGFSNSGGVRLNRSRVALGEVCMWEH
jgi:hypothetical protein